MNEVRAVGLVDKKHAIQPRRWGPRRNFLADPPATIGAHVSGRSSARRVDALLKRRPPHVGPTDMHVGFGFLSSEENIADDPSRHRAIRKALLPLKEVGGLVRAAASKWPRFVKAFRPAAGTPTAGRNRAAPALRVFLAGHWSRYLCSELQLAGAAVSWGPRGAQALGAPDLSEDAQTDAALDMLQKHEVDLLPISPFSESQLKKAVRWRYERPSPEKAGEGRWERAGCIPRDKVGQCRVPWALRAPSFSVAAALPQGARAACSSGFCRATRFGCADGSPFSISESWVGSATFLRSWALPCCCAENGKGHPWLQNKVQTPSGRWVSPLDRSAHLSAGTSRRLVEALAACGDLARGPQPALLPSAPCTTLPRDKWWPAEEWIAGRQKWQRRRKASRRIVRGQERDSLLFERTEALFGAFL